MITPNTPEPASGSRRLARKVCERVRKRRTSLMLPPGERRYTRQVINHKHAQRRYHCESPPLSRSLYASSMGALGEPLTGTGTAPASQHYGEGLSCRSEWLVHEHRNMREQEQHPLSKQNQIKSNQNRSIVASRQVRVTVVSQSQTDSVTEHRA